MRRNAGVAALVGAAASALAIAYVARAASTGGVLDWGFAVVLGGLGISQLVSLVDSRTPLLVADGFGIRLRLGREWRGLPWDSLEQVVVEPRTSLIHDGRLVVAPRHLNRALEGLDGKARRQVAVNQSLYAAPLVVPLGMTTRVSTDDLVTDLAELSHGRAAVVEIAGYVAQPVLPDSPATVSRRERIREGHRVTEAHAVGGDTQIEGHDPRTARVLGGLGTFVSRIGHGRAHDVDADQPHHEPATALHDEEPAAPSYPPAALLRDARPAARIEVRLDQPALMTSAAPKLRYDAERRR